MPAITNKFANNYDWSGLEYPVAINEIREFEKNNNVSVNVLGIKGPKMYRRRKSKRNDGKVVNLLLIADGEKRHYTMIKTLTRLLESGNSKHEHKQHFCLNCLQGFSLEISRDKHTSTVKTTKH